VVENPELVTISNLFQEALAKGDYPAYCTHKTEVTNSHFDQQIWALMKIICFDKSAREGLLKYLGFDSVEINAITSDYVATVTSRRDSKLNTLMGSSPSLHLTEELSVKAQEANINLNELVSNVLTANEAEPIIRQALVIGDFTLAVNCCIEAGLMTEALLLAQCGDNALWLQTQQIYFERTKQQKFFLSILQSIIKSELMEYVASSDLNKWKETLAILSTYGKSEEFPILCEKLGERLFQEKDDLLSSTLCYMCAINIHQTIDHWIINLKQRISANGNNVDIHALQEFIEKVIIYTQYNAQGGAGVGAGAGENQPAAATTGAAAAAAAGVTSTVQLSNECLYYFTEYSKLLASQGKTSVAGKYLKSNTLDEQILRDRIYHSEYLKPMGSRPPPFPFESVVVNTTAQIAPQSQVPSQVHNKTRSGSVDKSLPQQQVIGGGVNNPAKQAQGVSAHMPQAHQAQGGIPQAHQAVQKQPSQQTIQQQQHIPVAPAAPTQAPQLPPGWIQLVDPASGRPYFVDQATGQSQWDAPVAPQPVAPVLPVPQLAAPTSSQQTFHQAAAAQHREEMPTQPAAVTAFTPAAAAVSPVAAAVMANPTPVVTDGGSDSSVAALQNMFNELQGPPPHRID
jgi:protein transport protein SEC31